MALPYIKLENDECTRSQRDILLSEVSLLNISKKISIYKEIRKRELSKKTALKQSIKQASLKIALLMSNLPHSESAELKKISQEMKYSSKEVKKKNNIELELNEIKEKLAQLE